MDQRHGIRREHLCRIAACHTNPSGDIGGGLADLERPERAAQRDALFQLPKVRLVQAIAELGLTRQHDGQQLLIIRLDVGEQANLLEDLVRKRRALRRR